MFLNSKPRLQKVPFDRFLTEALVTKAVPLTASEETYLKKLRRIHTEKTKKMSFYQFLEEIVEGFGADAPEDPDVLHERIFLSEQFQMMMAYKDFRFYVFGHPNFSHFCHHQNKLEIDKWIQGTKKTIEYEEKQAKRNAKQGGIKSNKKVKLSFSFITFNYTILPN